MYNIKEMIAKNREKEKEEFNTIFKEMVIDLNNKINKAIESKKFIFEGRHINLETKNHPNLTKVVNKLENRESGIMYSNTINNAEYKVPSMKTYSNCAKLRLVVENHPNKIEYIDITDDYETGKYNITIG